MMCVLCVCFVCVCVCELNWIELVILIELNVQLKWVPLSAKAQIDTSTSFFLPDPNQNPIQEPNRPYATIQRNSAFVGVSITATWQSALQGRGQSQQSTTIISNTTNKLPRPSPVAKPTKHTEEARLRGRLGFSPQSGSGESGFERNPLRHFLSQFLIQ